MRSLYPEITEYNRFQLETGTAHRVYVEEAGNPQGLPVIFLHGGPGSGCSGNHRRYFDPERYRIVLFDQRGCNRSTPAGDTSDNSTPLLLADMESIRERLGIESWIVFGGSWGATLALLYAEQFPERVRGLVVRGTFLARESDLAWFIRHGANCIFPDAWQRFCQVLTGTELEDPIAACYAHMHGGDRSRQEVIACAWSRWAGTIATYLLPPEAAACEESLDTVINQVRIETHYARHRYFIEENQILDRVGDLPAVPMTIIHGRRDLTCTLEASWSLHRAIARSELVIVREGGHLASENVMTDALVRATDAMWQSCS